MYNWRGQSQSNPQYTTLAGFCSIRTLFEGKTARVVYWGLVHSDSDSFNYTYIPLVWNFSQRLSYSHRVWGSPRWCPSGTCWTGRSTLSSGEAQERGEWKEREDVQKEKEGYFVWLEFLRVIFSVKIMSAETVCGRAIHKIFLRKIGTSTTFVLATVFTCVWQVGFHWWGEKWGKQEAVCPLTCERKLCGREDSENMAVSGRVSPAHRQ